MVDNNLSGEPGPDVTTPQTYNEQIEDISNLLEDPAADPPQESQDEAAAEDDPLADPVGEEAEDVDADAADDPDGSEPEIKGGRFAPDTAKVTLDDGTVTTIAELKRGTLFQRDYTRKTTELAAEKSAFDTERQEVSQYAQSLNQSREYLAWYAENFLPKAPAPFTGDPAQDPMGYLQWSQARDQWATHAQAYQAFQQQKQVEEQHKSGETQKQADARMLREKDALLKAMPVFKDPARAKPAWEALVAGAQELYGISPQEVNTVQDHRMLVALRDAISYRRIKAKAPQVQAQVAQKPAMKSGRRAAPNAMESKGRQVRSERLRNSGSFEAGVAALQDFDL